MIGEPESAISVKDQVIRSAKLYITCVGVEHFELTGVEVNTLDAAAGVPIRHVTGVCLTSCLVELHAAVVADIDLAIGSYSSPIGSASEVGDHFNRAIWVHSAQRLARNLDQHDRSICHGNRAFGET